MSNARAWALFAGGFTVGGTAVGAYLWRRRPPEVQLGRIFRVGGSWFVDSVVVAELVRRVPGSGPMPSWAARRISVHLFRRGTLGFYLVDNLPRLPAQVGPHLYEMIRLGGETEEVAIELIHLGLARSGGAFPTWPTRREDGTWSASPGPLHPTAFDDRHAADNADVPAPRPPIGHYFRVGENFYADERFLETLEGIHGADYDTKRAVSIVPFWRRGHWEIHHMTDARMLPEQQGRLFTLRSHLTDGTSLGDHLRELESLGVMSWGGDWPSFPARLSGFVPTGPLPGEKTEDGRILETDDGFLLDEAAYNRLRSRLPLDPHDVLTWAGGRLRLVPGMHTVHGRRVALRHLETLTGERKDEQIRSFVSDLMFHKVAAHVDGTRKPPAEPAGEGQPA